MKCYLILIVLIINTLSVFGQQKTEVILKDSTVFDGKIMRYDDVEIKLMEKGKIYTIQKENILSPKDIRIKSSTVYTVIETNENKVIYGKIIKKTENTIVVRTSFKSEIVNKKDIVYQAFYVKKYYDETETHIETIDGNLFVGDVLKNYNNVTLIDVGNGMKQEIKNELITQSEDKRRSNKSGSKALIYSGLSLVSFVYLLN